MEKPLEECTTKKAGLEMTYPVFSASYVSPHASPGIFKNKLNYPEGCNE
jgi:hypothetical protein